MIHNNKNYVIGSGLCEDCDLENECGELNDLICGPDDKGGGWRLAPALEPPFDNVEDAKAYIAKSNGYPYIWCPLAGVECHSACPAYNHPAVTTGTDGYIIVNGYCTSPMLVG